MFVARLLTVQSMCTELLIATSIRTVLRRSCTYERTYSRFRFLNLISTRFYVETMVACPPKKPHSLHFATTTSKQATHTHHYEQVIYRTRVLACTSVSLHNRKRLGSRGQCWRRSDVKATPREGWRIDIPRFKVRVRFFAKQGNSSGYASRRGDQIYCPSRSSSGTSGALILKFRSKDECIAFFDRLVALNPTKTNRLLSQDKNKNTASTATRKRRMNPAIDLSSYKDDVSVKRRKGNVMSYLVRLLHDDSFLKFVNDIEDTLMSTQDGAAILAAMKRSPEPKAAPNHPVAAIQK